MLHIFKFLFLVIIVSGIAFADQDLPSGHIKKQAAPQLLDLSNTDSESSVLIDSENAPLGAWHYSELPALGHYQIYTDFIVQGNATENVALNASV